jgi:hypothetical protein
MGDLITDHCCQSNRIDPKPFLHLDSRAMRVRIGKGVFKNGFSDSPFALDGGNGGHAHAPPETWVSLCAQLWGFSAIGDLTDSVQAAPAFFTWPLDYNFGPQRR